MEGDAQDILMRERCKLNYRSCNTIYEYICKTRTRHTVHYSLSTSTFYLGNKVSRSAFVEIIAVPE